jgi:hypothetical protein
MEEIKKVEEITESPVTNVEVEPSSPIVEAKSSYEQQAMTRRQALGRLGFLAGAAAVAALSVDDLVRLAGREMEKRAGDNKLARKVAQEFSNAGVALAVPPSACGGPACSGNCSGTARYYCVTCQLPSPCPTTWQRLVPRPCASGSLNSCIEQMNLGVQACLQYFPTDPNCVKREKCAYCACITSSGCSDQSGGNPCSSQAQKSECAALQPPISY